MKTHKASAGAARTILPDPRVSPRYAGVCTFCRYPRIEDVPAENEPVDWAIYGVPFDAGVTYRSGARFGPRAIREASQYMKPVVIEQGVNLIETFSLADAGDSPVRPYSCEETVDTVIEFAAKIGDPAHTKLFAIGGDHSIAYPNIRATWERRGRPSGGLALLHFDAHVDTLDAVGGERFTHASPFRRAIEDGCIDPKRMLTVGVRGPLNSASDLDYGREMGIEVVTVQDLKERDGVARIHEFLTHLGDHETYLTFDIDSIDPAFAPGTGTPCCGGFTSTEALRLVRGCAGANIVGADLVEVLPDRDPAGVTALLASHMLVEILALAARPA